MRDFLNLLNVTTTDVVEADDAYVVEARSTEPRFQACRLFCPIRKNGKRVREINDTPIHGKPVLIRMQVHRGSCTECGKPALPEALPFLQPGFWMTRRLLDHIAKQAPGPPFRRVQRRILHRPGRSPVRPAEGPINPGPRFRPCRLARSDQPILLDSWFWRLPFGAGLLVRDHTRWSWPYGRGL